MPEKIYNTLINLGDLPKPVNTLIEKISDAGVGISAPWQIRRVANAEAEATLIKAEAGAKAAVIEAVSKINITDLQRRAAHRLIGEEAQFQKNMEEVTVKALPLLNENADPTSMDNDWIVNFFDKSRIVSDGEMQGLWSRILAGEANAPGTYAKRTVNFLPDLEKTEAALFTKLCGFVWTTVADEKLVPLVFDKEAEIYKRNGVDFSDLKELDSIGLIHHTGVTEGLVIGILPKRVSATYCGRPLALEMPNNNDNTLEIGAVILTRIGKDLAPICGSKPVEGFWEYVRDKWKKYLPKSETEQSLSETPNVHG